MKRIPLRWIPIAFALGSIVASTYWVLAVIVYPPYRVVDLSTVDGQPPLRVRSNDSGDLALSLGLPGANRLAILKDGKLTYSPVGYAGNLEEGKAAFDPVGINDADEVAGVRTAPQALPGAYHYDPGPDPEAVFFAWRSNGLTQYAAPRGINAKAIGINNRGDVCLSYQPYWSNDDFTRVVSIWNRNDMFTPLSGHLWLGPNHQIRELSPYHLNEDGDVYCDALVDSIPSQIVVDPSGRCRMLSPVEPSFHSTIRLGPKSEMTWEVIGGWMGSDTPPIGLLDGALDVPVQNLRPTRPAGMDPSVGAVFLSADPSPSLKLDSWRGWLRLIHPRPPTTLEDQAVDYPSFGSSQTVQGYPLAVIRTGNTLTPLESLISPISGWRLVTAQHIDKSGRIICIGKHNGMLDWCLLVPRGVAFELPPSPKLRAN